MKETGITRRVDELGRVVIPKEIRQVLKINVGTPMEIFLSEGKIILQKHCVLQKSLANANMVVDCLFDMTDKTILIFNREKIVSVKGRYSVDFANFEVNQKLLRRLNERRQFFCDTAEYFGVNNKFAFVVPFVDRGDMLGGVAILSDEEITATEVKLTHLAVKMFLRQLD